MPESKTFDRKIDVLIVMLLFYLAALCKLSVGTYIGFSKGWEHSLVPFVDGVIFLVTGYFFHKLQSRVFSVFVTILTLMLFMYASLPVEELQKHAEYVSWDFASYKYFNLLLFAATMSGTISIFKKKAEIKELRGKN